MLNYQRVIYQFAMENDVSIARYCRLSSLNRYSTLVYFWQTMCQALLQSHHLSPRVSGWSANGKGLKVLHVMAIPGMAKACLESIEPHLELAPSIDVACCNETRWLMDIARGFGRLSPQQLMFTQVHPVSLDHSIQHTKSTWVHGVYLWWRTAASKALHLKQGAQGFLRAAVSWRIEFWKILGVKSN